MPENEKIVEFNRRYKGIPFEEYLMRLTEYIKKEPENLFQISQERFAKALDEKFRESVNAAQEALLSQAKENAAVTDDVVEKWNKLAPKQRKALDSQLNIKQKKALDAYSNNAMLLGQADTFSSFDAYDFNSMLYAWPLWTSMYMTSWVFAKIIDRTGSDMIRNGWKISINPDRLFRFVRMNGKVYREDITPEYDMNSVYKKQSEALSYVISATKWMILYGGSVMCMLDSSITDIADYEKPLERIKKGAKLNFVVADRWQGVVASSEMVDDDESPDFNTPKYYSIKMPNGLYYRFHHTRVARFVNGDLPNFLKTMLLGWGLPIGTRIYNEINRDERIKNMITSLLSKYNLEIVQTAGMKAYMHGELTPEMEADLDYKLAMMNRYRHFNSMMFLDKDDVYQRLDGNVGGLYQLFDSNTRAVTGAASMPVVLLYGDQSQGLSGSSFDDLRLWDDHLNSERGAKLRKPIEKVTRWLLMSEGIPSDSFSINFNSSLPKTMNEKIDETRAVLDMYQQLMSMKLYDVEMVREELKERDDLLLGNQLQITSKEELEEIEEEAAEPIDEYGDFGGGMGGMGGTGGAGGGSAGGSAGGGTDFDSEPIDLSGTEPGIEPSEPIQGDAPIDQAVEPASEEPTE